MRSNLYYQEADARGETSPLYQQNSSPRLKKIYVPMMAIFLVVGVTILIQFIRSLDANFQPPDNNKDLNKALEQTDLVVLNTTLSAGKMFIGNVASQNMVRKNVENTMASENSICLANGKLQTIENGIRIVQDCTYLYGKYYRCSNGLCSHQNLFENFNMDMGTTALSFVAVTFAAMCGTGGGGILVPLYIALENFTPKTSIPLSKATIFGGSIANFIFNFRSRHPTADRPLIDLNIAMSFEPICLAGTTMGVLLNRIFPTWLIVTLLVILLGLTTYKTAMKGFKKMKQENNICINRDQYQSQFNPNYNEEAKTILENEKSFRLFPVLLLGLCWCIIILFAALRGGEGSPSLVGIQCGTWLYWILFFLVIPCMLAFTFIVGLSLVKVQKQKEESDYPFREGDIHWTKRNALYLPFANYCAGVCAGMLGIGGGMVQGPLLMILEVETTVAAATSAFMVLFTSAATSAQFILFGQLRFDYGVWFAGIGFLASILGQLILRKVIQKSGRTSFIIFILAAVVGLSAIFLVIQGVFTVIGEARRDGMGFRPVCSNVQ